jgi:HAE1 family hydrophobic/amphiphilic exporter-1
VIGGLTTASLLTLIVIPVLYIVFERIGERLRKLFGFEAAAVHHGHVLHES